MLAVIDSIFSKLLMLVLVALSGGNISSLRLEQSLQEKKVLVIVKFPYLVKAECIDEFG